MSDPIRNRELGLIHAAAERQGLDEETYRALLDQVAGVRSAADLDAAGRVAVLRRLGVRYRRHPRPTLPLSGGGQGGGDGGGGSLPPKPTLVSAPQWQYITDIARRLHLDGSSFGKLVKHIVGLDNPAWLDVPQARHLIAGLLRIEAAPEGGRRVPARGNPRRLR